MRVGDTGSDQVGTSTDQRTVATQTGTQSKSPGERSDGKS